MSANRWLIFLVVLALTTNIRSQSLQDIINQVDTIANPNIVRSVLMGQFSIVENYDDSLQAKFYFQLGISYGMLYKTDSAQLFLDKAVNKAKKSNAVLTEIGSLNALGNVARITSDNEDAKKHFENALKLATSKNTLEYLRWQSKLLGNIAGIFFELKDPKSALAYSKRGLAISRQIGDKKEIATNLIRLGYCYNALNKTDSALSVNREATGLLETTKDSLGLIYQYYNMANIHKSMNDAGLAKDYYNNAIDLAQRFGEAETEVGSLNELADIAIQSGEYQKARELLDKSIEVSKGNNMLFGLRRSYQLAYQADKRRLDYPSAIENLETYYQLNDSIQKTETLKSIEEFKVKYETAEKEKEILAAKREIEAKERFETFLMIVIAIIVVFGTIAIILLVQRFKLRRALLSQEIDTLRVQINSLFQGGIKELDVTLDDINSKLYQPLSTREFEILQEAISEKTNREIAETLYVSVNTVKYHLRNVYEKLGVSNRMEALEKILPKNS
ncbi:tetratricopeptide repeat protein [Fulvivirga lutea]|uniref:Tetratricopeptide repeat protein n=1 Tax=Fulvivirga lutea TaxID=2810512 RepID=A0A975A0Q1_9BACT|nr:tetratricopeptide repeat protein [Fulvivirga lutea]QSE97435.1 tetratricopeptide repeat protein [Fulvivirga lutea]